MLFWTFFRYRYRKQNLIKSTDLFKDENFIFESVCGICHEIFLELVPGVQVLISVLSGWHPVPPGSRFSMGAGCGGEAF